MKPLKLSSTSSPQKNAEEIREHFNCVRDRDGLHDNPMLEAVGSDVEGLLVGIARGTITVGQPRIASSLLRIIESYPEGCDPDDMINVLGASSERGLTAERQSVGPRPGRHR